MARCKSKTGRHNQDRSRRAHSDGTGLNCGDRSWIRNAPLVSVLLGFSAMLSVSLVSRVTARSLHDNMLGCQSPSGERS